MWVTRRFAGADLGVVLDAGLGIAGTAMMAIIAWAPPWVAGTAVAGPAWLRAVLPLLTGAPLAARRRAPLAMWSVIWAGISLQALVTRNAPSGLGLTLVLLAGSYAVAAYSGVRRAIAGLAVTVAGVTIYFTVGHAHAHDMFGGYTLVGSLSPNSLFAGEIAACWVVGMYVRARRQAAALAARNAALQHRAEQAAVAERARIARELHDIVAHHLSVVVLQAAGARASGRADPATLEKIEHSGRQALAETRRLFGVLREPDEETGRAPQPGVSELPALAGSLRAVGLPVSLVIDGNHIALPPAVNVSAYRIVQEALTNVLKHAGPARAEVTVGCADSAVTIEVTDDGAGNPAPPELTGGQGLAGMRERVAVFGGDLRAGPRPGGGFTVCARLPTGEPP